MSIATLNEVLRQAKDSSKDLVRSPAGTHPLDQVLLSDLYADSLEASATTSFITIIYGPGVITVGSNTCQSTCNCASVDTEADDVLPVRFEL